MSADWDYAQMAKTASRFGGPQEYLDVVKDGARSQGRIEGGIGGMVLAAAVTAVGLVGPKAYRLLRDRASSKRAAVLAEQELIKGMTDSPEDEQESPPDPE